MASLDLVALWETHCRYEFETRDVNATMATMVAEPYWTSGRSAHRWHYQVRRR
jgi:hypothetical protein